MPSVRHGRELGSLILVFTIALAYAPTSPIVLPFALLYFAASWLYWRYNVLVRLPLCTMCAERSRSSCPGGHFYASELRPGQRQPAAAKTCTQCNGAVCEAKRRFESRPGTDVHMRPDGHHSCSGCMDGLTK